MHGSNPPPSHPVLSPSHHTNPNSPHPHPHQSQNKCIVLERNPACPATGGPTDSSAATIHEAYEAIAKQLPHSLLVLYHTKVG